MPSPPGARCYDLSKATADATAGMLPVLREQARRRAVEAAGNEPDPAQGNLARVVADSAKRR